MADYCALLTISVAGKDLSKAAEVLNLKVGENSMCDNLAFVDETGEGYIELHEVNWGGNEELRALIEEGIPYEAYHTHGDDYGEMCLAFIGDDEDPSSVEVCSEDYVPVAAIGEDLTPQPETLDEISRYYRIKEKVRSYINNNKTEVEEDEVSEV